ncbi:uncharacterized protein LOC112600014 [Melanaphis sacchari]|uniref:uncharacterized protein LOC112600014 n=1 Tax=Melanaphis sacchari TaxID=742174 RepID=UPI000DC14E57|nr:uncharacterized protein LOC112600014 [Melanaphis sacchari]
MYKTSNMKKSEQTHQFILMDFEFTNIYKTSIVLISGAISNSFCHSKTVKLEGKPLLLPVNQNVRQLSNREIRKAISVIKMYLKQELQIAVLRQLHNSINTRTNNLNAEFIKRYLAYNKKITIIVLWNGSTDMAILKRLKINNYNLLNMTCFDVSNDQHFYIQLINMINMKIIYQYSLGMYNKQGRMLSLVETHSLICSKQHEGMYPHDPCYDLELTKCIFNKMVKQFQYKNLVKHF